MLAITVWTDCWKHKFTALKCASASEPAISHLGETCSNLHATRHDIPVVAPVGTFSTDRLILIKPMTLTVTPLSVPIALGAKIIFPIIADTAEEAVSIT